MSVIQFSSALPENTKDTYNPFDNVDFMVYPEGRSLMLNKLRLVGKLSVRDGLNRFTKIASRLASIFVILALCILPFWKLFPSNSRSKSINLSPSINALLLPLIEFVSISIFFIVSLINKG